VTFNIAGVAYSAAAVVTVIAPIEHPSAAVTPISIVGAQSAAGSNVITVTFTYPNNLQDILDAYLIDALITITGTDLAGKYIKGDASPITNGTPGTFYTVVNPVPVPTSPFRLTTITDNTSDPVKLKLVDGNAYVWKFSLWDNQTATATTEISSAFQLKVQSITSSDNFRTTVVLGEATIDVKPAPTPPTPPIPYYIVTLNDPKWTTEKEIGLSNTSSPVLAVSGRVAGVQGQLDRNEFSITFDGIDLGGITIPVIGYNDFTFYFKYAELAQRVNADGILTVTYDAKSDSVPVNLFKITTKDAVPEEVTSGQKVTITGTVAPIQANTLTPSQYKVYVWKDGTTAVVTSTVISDTGTFSITFNTYGDEDQEYYVTVQKPVTTPVYNEAPYYILTVTKLADVAVSVTPDTIVAGSTNNITLQLKVGDVKLATHNVTGTVALGDKKVPFTATTDSDGKVVVTGINFGNTGVADITVKVIGPDYYGTGSAKLVVSTSAEYLLNVQWPDTWKIGEKNTVTFISPVATNPVKSVTVTVTGPVVEAGEALTGEASIELTPLGYGTLTLKVEAKLNDGTKVSKTFTTTIPGYVATVEPAEIERGATTTLTVVVKDAYGNPVNNALVQFFSPVNSNDVIAELDGTATTAVNNGTYKLLVKGSDIKNADEDAYVRVNNSAGKKQAYIPVEIMPSLDITIALEKSEIVLGPKTTLSATFTAPVDLIGSVVKILDADEEDTGILNYVINKTGTVVALTLPIETMPEEAGTYQLVVANPNHKGTATLTFVEPVITASPAELLAGETTVVTFTSANVKDLTAVTKVTATGAISKITAKTATDAITATVVTANVKGTGTVTFEFNSGYKFDLPISVAYGKLTVGNATIAFGTKVLAFTPVNAAGATLAVGTEVKINLLGNEYSGYVAADGSVKILIPELPMGTYNVLVKVAGYQDATFSLVVAEAEPEYKTVIELAPGMDIYTVNGETKFWDATPYIKEGRTLVPIRHLAEAVGFKADWDFSDPANKMVFIFKADQDPEKDKEHPFILLIIGQPTAMVNGNLVALDVAPEILNGRTMVPLRFVVETLGYKVEWLGNTIRLMK